jgi:two-component system, NtrC family, response regulator AtoC
MTAMVLLHDPEKRVPHEIDEELSRHVRIERSDEDAPLDTGGYELVLVTESRAADVPVERGAPRVLVLSDRPSLGDVVGAIRAGAMDIVRMSPPSSVVDAVRSALSAASLEAELARLKDVLPVPANLPELLGESKAMQRLRTRIERVANSDATALVSGPSGTGKDLVAKALHRLGPRHSGPFVAVACGAVPRHLVESEFFGYARGAFTGAAQEHAGLLARASGGTLFLDEVGEMSLELQAKLLRAVQERRIRPLGQSTEVGFDARIIASTSRDLEQEVRSGRFREDLFFRLNVVTVRTPALATRERDVLILAQHFIRRASKEDQPRRGMTPAAAHALLCYGWPGNVRELENCIVAALAATRTDHVTELDLPAHLHRVERTARDHVELSALDDVERAHILKTLHSVDGNRALASRILRLDRKTLHRKLKRYSSENAPLPSSDVGD